MFNKIVKACLPNRSIKLHLNQVLATQNLQKLNGKFKNILTSLGAYTPPEFAPPPLQ